MGVEVAEVVGVVVVGVVVKVEVGVVVVVGEVVGVVNWHSSFHFLNVPSTYLFVGGVVSMKRESVYKEGE
jgi:hypothetical protein